MDVGLTTASFATKTQTAISHKHSKLYGGGEGEVLTEVSPASGSRKTATLPTKRSTTTLVRPATAGSTATWSGRGSRETTPTRSPGGTWGFQFQFKYFLHEMKLHLKISIMSLTDSKSYPLLFVQGRNVRVSCAYTYSGTRWDLVFSVSV